MNLFDILFPKYCVNCKKLGDYLCTDCFSKLSFVTKNICLPCGKPSYDGLTHPRCRGKMKIEGSFTGVVFNKVSRKLIYQFKYRPYLSELGSFLSELLYESLIQNEEFMRHIANGKWLMVPIPLSSIRHKRRGYNQSEVLAKNLAKKFDLEVLNCLERIKETRSQVGLGKKERRENIKGAFALNSKFIIHNSELKNANIFLVDDVLTTGSTISEAAVVLKRSGANKVWGVAFAREQ